METPDLLPALMALAVLAAARAGDSGARRVQRLLDSRWAPWVAAALASLAAWWVWGSMNEPPLVTDEVAYLFQARLFAAGRWSAPTPALPEFFQQWHVLLAPVYTAKYPPGHALVLAIGVALGLTGLVPVLLMGATAGLLFALARRLAGSWVATLAFLCWTTAPTYFLFRPSYFSEVTTGFLWLAAWWALLEWRETRARRFLLLLAFCVGWMAITRPLTAVAFAIPTGAVTLALAWRRRAWSDLAAAMAVGTAVLAILPLWSARTMGDWRRTPLEAYTADYLPFDRLGFGLDSTPAKPLPPDLEEVSAIFRDAHARYTPAAVPAAVVLRVHRIGREMWGGWRTILVPLAVIGVVSLAAEGVVALATALLLVAAYLAYAHLPAWSIYYYEAQPFLAFVTALGAWRAIGWAGAWAARRRTLAHVFAGREALLALCLVVLLLPQMARDLEMRRWRKSGASSYYRWFRDALARLPADRAVVFVRYGPKHNPHRGVVTNEPDLERARVWVVYDRGAENERLMQVAPDRTAYLFDEANRAFVPLPSLAEGPVTR